MSLSEARVVTRVDAAALTAYRNGRLGDVVVAEDGSGAGIVTDPTAAPTPIGAGSGFVPTNDNLTDLGDASHQFRTLFLGTSLVNAGDLTISLSGGATRTLTIENPTPAQIANVQIDGQVTALQGGTFVGCYPYSNNAQDLGTTGTRWRTLYLATSLDTPLITRNGDLTVELAGGGGGPRTVVLTHVGTTSRVDLSVSGIVQTYGTEILMAAVPTATIRCNGINGSLRLRADGNGVVALRDPADSVTVLGVTGHGVVVSSAVDAGVGPTINRPSGVVTIPSGSTAITVNNDLVAVGPPASMVHATIQNATTNPVSVLSAVPGPGVLIITLSGDPGASGAEVAFLVLNASA